jgi:hypothetical protein
MAHQEIGGPMHPASARPCMNPANATPRTNYPLVGCYCTTFDTTFELSLSPPFDV